MRKSAVIALGGLVTALAALGIGWHYWGSAVAPAGQPELVELHAKNLADFQARFNEARGVRVVALLSPT